MVFHLTLLYLWRGKREEGRERRGEGTGKGREGREVHSVPKISPNTNVKIHNLQ